MLYVDVCRAFSATGSHRRKLDCEAKRARGMGLCITSTGDPVHIALSRGEWKNDPAGVSQEP